jgi:hypothetical protein
MESRERERERERGKKKGRERVIEIGSGKNDSMQI